MWQELLSKRFEGEEGEERVGQPMTAEAKGINPDITTEVTEEVKEIAFEVKEEVKEATAEVVDKLAPRNKAQLFSLRETLCSEGFDQKRGWRRIVALLGSTNSPFCR
jgi:SH3-like domain-containing protein